MSMQEEEIIFVVCIFFSVAIFDQTLTPHTPPQTLLVGPKNAKVRQLGLLYHRETRKME